MTLSAISLFVPSYSNSRSETNTTPTLVKSFFNETIVFASNFLGSNPIVNLFIVLYI